VRTFTEKLLAYAIGRGIGLSDMPVVRGIARDAAPRDDRWSAIIWGIVNSSPFNMGVASEAKPVNLAQGRARDLKTDRGN
jgi:hypothetical protein